MDYRSIIQKIQQKIGEIDGADGIEESLWWNIVLRELNDMSVDCARELQNEPGAPQYIKPAGPQAYEKMPPSRLLALTVSIVSWLGWISHQKCGDIYNWKRISESFEFGRNASLANETF